MSISVRIQGKNKYIIYGYSVNNKVYRIYCGKKGLPSTELNIKKAKKKHLEAKIKHSKEKLK